MPLTKYQRERIVSLHLQSKGSASNILKIIAIERIYTTKQTVLNTLLFYCCLHTFVLLILTILIRR